MKKSGPNKKDATAKVKNTRQDHNEESSIQDDSDTAAAIAATAAAVTSHPIPKIMPGERLSDFSLRVDQSLPLTGVPKHKTRETVAGLNIKTPLTKHNKRLARMQRDWRTQEEKIRDREEEAEDDLAERKEEDGLLWLGVEAGQMRGKGKNKRSRIKRTRRIRGRCWRGSGASRSGMRVRRVVLVLGLAVGERVRREG